MKQVIEEQGENLEELNFLRYFKGYPVKSLPTKRPPTLSPPVCLTIKQYTRFKYYPRTANLCIQVKKY